MESEMLTELCDSINDRVLKTEKAPPHKFFEINHLYSNRDLS